ncbi:nitrate/sulfonate/bicarbonate ABC transporter ATP-binding protein [Halalkalibacter wakoensis JCM 9140]|uniref:Nitrate/sulfonate/bicarbonate ABC transporter ATP-binding protein n=1 Tax=Halalkalibacter wakoensis JCM 9140 TaxID=1236970 RepID=W4Q4P6_9BACI|nr:ABC transporter ATP-binding protein [Halalkalibacter wakoensis]GAE26957.1 nitrate/sulfonate/bicarbonate ABC transporter ATP-binding protein [Halalkalibacter wakoensis JCM 9140]
MPIITCRDVALQFTNDQTPVLDQIQLDIQEGEFVSILGKSGSGKTTLLQLLGGLLSPTKGVIKVLGRTLTSPFDEITYVFQKPILLEWRNVLENVLIPLELKRKPNQDDIDKAYQVLSAVGLKQHVTKYPHELSGGMMSRVTLARAFLMEPKILLMDEPFSALDAMTKEQLHLVLLKLTQQFSTTTVFITHDITEATYLSDRVVLLGGYPAHVKQEFPVTFSRPRSKKLTFDSRFIATTKQLYDLIEGLEDDEKD